MTLQLTLDGADVLNGASVRLLAEAQVTVAPAMPPSLLATCVTEALAAAIAFGQRRYGVYRDELPERRAAVEAAATPALEAKLADAGHTLGAFALVALTLAPH